MINNLYAIKKYNTHSGFIMKIATATFAVASFFNTCAMDDNQILDLTTKNPLVRTAAQKHNKQTLLLSFSQNCFDYMLNLLVDPNNKIEESIKDSLALSATCTYFNNLLPRLGTLHEKYPINQRNTAMKKVQHSPFDLSYSNRRRAIFLLIHAKAEHNTRPTLPLLRRTVFCDDVELATALFHHGANANETIHGIPCFFSVKSKSMIELFTQHGAEWQFIEPITFPGNSNSVMHAKASMGRQEGNFEVLSHLLLSIIPSNMINRLNKLNKTPLDCACESPWPDDRIITLLRSYGAMLSQELEA
jgi:hypothetical protein